MAEAKSAAKAEEKRKLSSKEFHVKQLEDRLKRLEHKRDKRVPHFSEADGKRDAAKDRVDRDIMELRKMIAKAKRE